MEQQISEFFDNEFPSFAIYNLYRMVGSYVDGLKPSSRKVVFTLEKHKGRIKVAQLSSEVAKETQYLHGETNLSGVIVNMAQNFPGSNTFPLLQALGSFGNRCIPEAAAPRYIHTAKSEFYDKLFNADDRPLLPNQVFEGQEIEPMFYVPTLPIILINGSEGVGSGWSQKILPRDPAEIVKLIKKYLKTGKLPKSIAPHYSGFTGDIVSNEDKDGWLIRGKFERESQTKIRVTEIPITYTLDKYNNILSELEERKVISSFKDLSEPKNSKFEFVITARRDFVNLEDDVLLKKLKLVSRLTENFTCMDENNIIREFNNEIEILEAFIKIRLEYYQKRKDNLINKLNNDRQLADEKYKFVKQIMNGALEVFKRKKVDIINDLKAFSYVEIDGSYNHLLNMPIHSFSQDTLDELATKVETYRKELIRIEKMAPADFWEEDLK